MSEEKVDQVLRALSMTSPRPGFTARAMQAIALAEQARRMRQMIWSLLGAGALSAAMMTIVIASGALRLDELKASATLFLSHGVRIATLLLSAVQIAPVFAGICVSLAVVSCALTTLLLERSVRARA